MDRSDTPGYGSLAPSAGYFVAVAEGLSYYQGRPKNFGSAQASLTRQVKNISSERAWGVPPAGPLETTASRSTRWKGAGSLFRFKEAARDVRRKALAAVQRMNGGRESQRSISDTSRISIMAAAGTRFCSIPQTISARRAQSVRYDPAREQFRRARKSSRIDLSDFVGAATHSLRARFAHRKVWLTGLDPPRPPGSAHPLAKESAGETRRPRAAGLSSKCCPRKPMRVHGEWLSLRPATAFRIRRENPAGGRHRVDRDHLCGRTCLGVALNARAKHMNCRTTGRVIFRPHSPRRFDRETTIAWAAIIRPKALKDYIQSCEGTSRTVCEASLDSEARSNEIKAAVATVSWPFFFCVGCCRSEDACFVRFRVSELAKANAVSAVAQSQRRKGDRPQASENGDSALRSGKSGRDVLATHKGCNWDARLR
jgi:hypothetical protein